MSSLGSAAGLVFTAPLPPAPVALTPEGVVLKAEVPTGAVVPLIVPLVAVDPPLLVTPVVAGLYPLVVVSKFCACTIKGEKGPTSVAVSTKPKAANLDSFRNTDCITL